MKKYTKKTTIMNFVESRPNATVSRKDLIRFIRALNCLDYNPTENRGYYSCALCPTCTSGGYLLRPSEEEPRFLVRIHLGEYKVKHWIH